ncbi:hypothetical protein GGS20DRAFT_569997 [Poronia punctata]|nr:hypothetical protein GGS20DRAFT_569997 [Poronia punctata]
MANSREERMQQRMRGAGRHEVADDSFGFVLPGAEASSEPPSSVPQLRSEPNTSAKRRRLGYEPESAGAQLPNLSFATRSSARLSSARKPGQNGAIQLDSTPTAGIMAAHLGNLQLDKATPHENADEHMQDVSPAAEATAEATPTQEDYDMLAEPVSGQSLRGSAMTTRSDEPMLDVMEIVTESPVTAPGSGRRRRIVSDLQTTQSAKLQRVVMEAEAGDTGDVASSSPLARKARQSRSLGKASPLATRASARRTPSSPVEELPESSPLARLSHKSNSTEATGSARSTRSQSRRSNLSTVSYGIDALSSPPDAAGTSSPMKARRTSEAPVGISKTPYDISEDDAEDDGNDVVEDIADDAVDDVVNVVEDQLLEVGDTEPEEVESAAEIDPVEKGLEVEEAGEIDDSEAARHIGRKRYRVSPRQKKPPDDVSSPAAEIEEPSKKSRQKRKQVSPAKQAQPKRIKKTQRAPSKRKGDGATIPVIVQRYTKPLLRNESDTEEDILNAEMPFTDHKSPNVVDVVLQMCEESIEKYLSTLHDEATRAEGAADRKMFRTKLRVLEAFQEELRTRLQAQTIALDNLRTLKKRVRAAQKEKILLRNEILRIRAEREQVALKMDAVRSRHETANKETMHQLGISSTMDDIELAIENGRAAPEPNAKEHKKAELANLDLLISQIGNQVTATGYGGGALKQIKDFNMFLERAALALEGRSSMS